MTRQKLGREPSRYTSKATAAGMNDSKEYHENTLYFSIYKISVTASYLSLRMAEYTGLIAEPLGERLKFTHDPLFDRFQITPGFGGSLS